LDPPAAGTVQYTCSTRDFRRGSGQEETYCCAPLGKALPNPMQFRKRVNTSVQKKRRYAGWHSGKAFSSLNLCLPALAYLHEENT